MVLMIASLIMSQVESTCQADKYMRFVYRLLPGFSLGNGLISLSFLAQLPFIDTACDRYAGIVPPLSAFNRYNAFDMKAVGWNCVFMAVETVVYLLLAILIDIGLSYPSIRQRFSRDPQVPIKPVEEDIDVINERERVAKQTAALVAGNPLPDTDVILVDRLRKVYSTGKVAVRDLSYGIPAGQCFGFLGINGAGKTTTLQMLGGDVLPTTGTAYVAGYDILTRQQEVRRLLGYCPQFEALLDLLTVREHLQLYARIKGIPHDDMEPEIQKSMKQFDLLSFENKKAGTLSGGNKRKLSVAIAMLGSPPLVLLDEPSSGMDPVAKRFMWAKIAEISAVQKCSVILTTHSMEEVEALCSRVCIMVGGRIRGLGSSQHLKSRYGQGFQLETSQEAANAEQIAAAVAELRVAAKLPEGTDRITRSQVLALASVSPIYAQVVGEIHDNGNGWGIHQAFIASVLPSATAALDAREITVQELAAWWAQEALALGFLSHVTTVAFPGSELLERHGSRMRFAIPAQAISLSELFRKVEECRSTFSVAGYSLGQTSLEQIFNFFASQQEEETGRARGFVEKPQTPAPDAAEPVKPVAAVAAAFPPVAAVATA
jgi:ATP-binding cassette subfamily A (ABC1) protein 3